jgi:predicted permease
MQQLKIAIRALLKTPGFTLGAVLTIAVAIGANTALFSVFDRLVLRPVTLPQPSSLVAIWVVNTSINFVAPAASWPRYEDTRAHATSFASMANSAFDSFTLTGNGEPEQLAGLRVTASFLPTLGVAPARGRNFSDAEDVPNGANVCLISHELWQTRFGGRESIVGETIQLNGLSWQVVGVTPPHLSTPFAQTQVFAPRVYDVGGLTPTQVQNGAGYSQPIARLKPGVTIAQAAAELGTLGRSYHERFAAKLDANNALDPRDFVGTISANLRPTFYTLLGAVVFVLLIACANVASLFLGRLSARHREIAVRQSLGATRGDIVGQFMIESLVFSAAAGGLGVIVALWALSGIQSTLTAQLPPNTTLTLDWRALLFTAGVTVACAMLVGLAPAWQASKAQIAEVLKDGARGPSGGRGGRFRATLIVAEVALSIVLLVGSALLLLSFLRLQRASPGFNPKGLAAAFVGVPQSRYATPGQQQEFFVRVIERLRGMPGVKSAGAAIGLPLSGLNPRSPYSVAGRPVLPLPQRPLAGLGIVSDDYFRLLEIPIRAGRAFNAQDRESALGVCIINEALARRLFPGESPLGHVMLRGRDADIPAEIVGVIADVRTNGVSAPVPDEIYFPMHQLGRPGMAIIAGTDGDAAALQSTLRAAVADVDKDQPISFFATVESTVAQSLGAQRIVASLTAAFAGVALALAAIGLYSVVAYAVTQRTGEIGIRMALGARPRQVVAREMRSGLQLVAVGVTLGLAAAAGAARVIHTLLFDVQPIDPVVYGGVAALFAAVAAVACFVPSLRASRIDPLAALRAA